MFSGFIKSHSLAVISEKYNNEYMLYKHLKTILNMFNFHYMKRKNKFK